MSAPATTRTGGRERLAKPEPPPTKRNRRPEGTPDGGRKGLQQQITPGYAAPVAVATLNAEFSTAERFLDKLDELSPAYPNARNINLIMLAFCMTSEATPAISGWIGQHGIEFAHVLNLLEVMAVHGITTTGRLFSIGNGDPAIVFPVHDEGMRPVDLIAWRPNDRLRWWLLLDQGAVLGAPNVVNPASYVDGPLKVHPSPLEWLQAGCQDGVVILNAARARPVLRQALGPIAATDIAHARRLERALAPEITADRILIPEVAA